jgi:hypothetical protein
MLKSRVLRVLRVMVLLPVAAFLWMIGWGMMWVGSKKEAHAKKSKDDPVALQSDDEAVSVGISEDACAILNEEQD